MPLIQHSKLFQNDINNVNSVQTVYTAVVPPSLMVFFSNWQEGNVEMSFVHASLHPQISQFQMLCKVGQNFMKTM